jgi:imidazolonepropionase-like amidohydrolase
MPFAIAIDDGGIVDVGTSTSFVGVREFEFDNGTVLPGFIDMHVHVEGALANAQGALLELLHSGVTAARDVGSSLALLDRRALLDSDPTMGPQLYVGGPLITAPGGHPAGTLYANLPATIVDQLTRQVDAVSEGEAAVDELADAGVDHIKAVLTGHFNVEIPRLDLGVLEAVIARAHARGLHVTVHTDSNQDVIDAVQAGADTIEHGVTNQSISPAAAQALAGVSYTPTLGVFAVLCGPVCAYPGQNLQTARSQGAKVIVGTDTEQPNTLWSFGRYADELDWIGQAGVSATDVLLAATRDAAAELGTADGSTHLQRAGTLEVGKWADVVVVSGDPTSNIQATGSVLWVAHRGHIVRQ